MWKFFKLFMNENKENSEIAKQPTIKELRQKGYKVRVTRARIENSVLNKKTPQEIRENYNFYLQLENTIEGSYRSPKGGQTLIQLRTPDGREVSGSSLCSPTDQFNRKLGNEIALKRALEKI